ncbi:VOC family protein [Pelistega suis]|uniref:VOC family protein n=1 Tax=Pelistega suis TaxID=1631957 RepID=A0A849P3D9_9BURK|nr:VOC family protein [Pelistega suis]MCQ9329472.1 VOC family protein [Pelistega suis]NOL50563.1 VOC family protein [Pelistega suis]
MNIERLDHFVLTVADIQRTVQFYTSILGMQAKTFGEGRVALHYGQQKINLHLKGHEIEPKAQHAICGSADLCFITSTPIESVLRELQEKQVDIIDGIVPRTGALGPIQSIYFRDPDGNLIEVSAYSK